jgi:hypothetical protein
MVIRSTANRARDSSQGDGVNASCAPGSNSDMNQSLWPGHATAVQLDSEPESRVTSAAFLHH